MSTEQTMVGDHSQGATVVSASTNSLLALFGVLSLNEWAALVGIICGIGTFGVNWFYRHKEHMRRERGK